LRAAVFPHALSTVLCATLDSVPLSSSRPGPAPELHSFPTRRSSDLRSDLDIFLDYARRMGFRDNGGQPFPQWHDPESATAGRVRSEEHTSELQSRFDLVCRLLLEKKTRKNITTIKMDERDEPQDNRM